jgi:putative membrane protein
MTIDQLCNRLFAAVLCVSCMTALAQQQPGQPGPDGNYPGVGIPANLSVNTSLVDRSFLSDTLKRNQTEIAMSQMAQQKSPSNDVKQYAQNMVQMSTQLSAQLKPMSDQLNLNEPKQSKQDKQALAKLQTLSGPAFDTAYLQGMAKEQQQTLKEFQQEEDGTQSSVLKNTAQADQTTLKNNYAVLQKLAAAHNVTISK